MSKRGAERVRQSAAHARRGLDGAISSMQAAVFDLDSFATQIMADGTQEQRDDLAEIGKHAEEMENAAGMAQSWADGIEQDFLGGEK